MTFKNSVTAVEVDGGVLVSVWMTKERFAQFGLGRGEPKESFDSALAGGIKWQVDETEEGGWSCPYTNGHISQLI